MDNDLSTTFHFWVKSDLIKILKQKDREFLTKYLKDILPLQQWLVKNKMRQSIIITSEDYGLSEVSTIKAKMMRIFL